MNPETLLKRAFEIIDIPYTGNCFPNMLTLLMVVSEHLQTKVFTLEQESALFEIWDASRNGDEPKLLKYAEELKNFMLLHNADTIPAPPLTLPDNGPVSDCPPTIKNC